MLITLFLTLFISPSSYGDVTVSNTDYIQYQIQRGQEFDPLTFDEIRARLEQGLIFESQCFESLESAQSQPPDELADIVSESRSPEALQRLIKIEVDPLEIGYNLRFAFDFDLESPSFADLDPSMDCSREALGCRTLGSTITREYALEQNEEGPTTVSYSEDWLIHLTPEDVLYSEVRLYFSYGLTSMIGLSAGSARYNLHFLCVINPQ